jgi:hypothetical protein
VLSSFAFTLENAAIEDYRNGASNIPSDSQRLVSSIPRRFVEKHLVD